MSIQVTTAPGALVALGIGAGDVASIISLGQRIGNWWTGPSGDNNLLELLDEEASDILKRRGLMDVLAFNKRWRKQIRLLGNGVPLNLREEDIQDVLKDTDKLLEELPLFTSVMICIVAVLDHFVSRSVVQPLLYKILSALLDPTERGLEILRSQYISRLNAWRSTACIRGLSDAVERYKDDMLGQGHILPGYMPASDAPHIEAFVLWLLGSNTDSFETVSSDVAGVATCLCSLGIDVLSVEGGFFESNPRGSCHVIYSKDPILHDGATRALTSAAILKRNATMIVSLKHPPESISIFPITKKAQTFCRMAWEEGIKAAAAVAIGLRKFPDRSGEFLVVNVEEPLAQFTDIQYSIFDQGAEVERTSTGIMSLAESFGLVLNQELIEGLQNSLHRVSEDVLPWFIATTKGDARAMSDGFGISDPNMTDESKVDGFCILQSFFMGYYYDIFGRLVDTSTLVSQTVEGCWGFRSETFLRYMEMTKNELPSSNRTSHHLTMSRQQILPILARLFLGSDAQHSFVDDPRTGATRRSYMGIIGKRTLLINSLLGKCSSPSEIGGFTIIDVDVGGIPRDSQGLICPGVKSEFLESDIMGLERMRRSIQHNLCEKSTDEDVTFNIEPDWDGNPDTTLICARYKGRRITAMSPLISDRYFCLSYVPPRPHDMTQTSAERSRLEMAVEMTISDLIREDSKLLSSGDVEVPILFQALNRPYLRYCAASSYKDSPVVCFVATDSVRDTLQSALAWQNQPDFKVLCTGASGYVGGQLLHELTQAHPEYTTATLVRDANAAETIAKAYPRVRTVVGDLDDSALVEQEASQALVVLSYLIQISGASLLPVKDLSSPSFKPGEPSSDVWDDLDGVSSILDLIRSHDSRVVDNYILKIAKETPSIKIALVLPPIIYGKGQGPVKQRSVQIPALSKVAIERGHAVRAGRGLAAWSNVHVADLARLFTILAEKGAEGSEDENVWGEKGIYLPGVGELTWADISDRVAKAAKDQGLIDTLEVEELYKPEVDTALPAGSVFFGSNARSKPRRATEVLGWKPKETGLDEEIPRAVAEEAEARK
ncbi:hypothetical protein FCOIX_2531 [Fusarium coicis]|nr:hypothetical protein FCOIX_2531 [Fusarium coicis]